MGMGVHDEYWGKTVMPCSNKYDKPQLLLLYHLALGYMSLLYALYSRANIDCISACVDGPMNQAIKSQLEVVFFHLNLRDRVSSAHRAIKYVNRSFQAS